MKYVPNGVVSTDLDVAKAAYFGGEFMLYMSFTPAILLGQVDLTGVGTGTWTPSPGAAMRAAGGDLQIVPITPVQSAVALTITLAGLDTSGVPAAVSATATFAPPARAVNQSFNFARGFAQDMVLNPRVTNSTTRAITGNVATITSPGHGYQVGQHITTTGFGLAAYNVVNVAITAVSTNTFSYAVVHADEAATADLTGVITPVGNTQLFSALTAVQVPTVVGGGINQSFRVYQLPEQADFDLIEAQMEVDFNTKDRVAKGIDAGMESDYWVKRGKAAPGDLSIGAKFKGIVDGMARYSGSKCTAMLLGKKEGQTTVDRLVFTQWVGAVKPKLPEGDGEATSESAGKFVDHLFFVAP